jgi:hypothetical protein
MAESGHVHDTTALDRLYAVEKSRSCDGTSPSEDGRDLRFSSTIKPAGTPTTHLADTADVVREVSKKIGRARVKWDNPQSVMIITKPGDLTLVRKTRQLALWFIRTPRYGQPSGITVYVDEKLKQSKRFKLEKYHSEYPDLEDKLRFWTPDLCATHPKLFDFIVTVCLGAVTISCILTARRLKFITYILAWRRWNGSLHIVALSNHCATRHSIPSRFLGIFDSI